MRKMTFSVPEPLAVQFLNRVASRDAALIRACEIANQDFDLAEIESEFDALSDGIAEPWKGTRSGVTSGA